MQDQADLFTSSDDLDLVRSLLADMHDDLRAKISRFRYLMDISSILGAEGTMMPGGEIAYSAWLEVRTSYIHGNYVATVLLCQGLAEQMLAAQLDLGLDDGGLPNKITFTDTLKRSVRRKIITELDAEDLSKLMKIRNPLTHYRNINDPTNLTRRAMESFTSAQEHLHGDATFAISMAVRLLALPAKQLGFAPVKLGKLNEGGALVHAHGRTWDQLIFKDLFKKEP